MDQVDDLIRSFCSRGKRNQSLWKLDVLMDLGRLNDRRVVQFFVAVVTDAEEPIDVRLDVLRRVGAMPLCPNDRALAARTMVSALAPDVDERLRLSAAIVLGELVDVDDVLEALGALAGAEGESTELRYNAYTSLQRAGPTTACIEILRALSDDETFGPSAKALMASWGVA